MIKLLTAFWNIMLKRSGQETLPDSNFFLGLVFVYATAIARFAVFGFKINEIIVLSRWVNPRAWDLADTIPGWTVLCVREKSGTMLSNRNFDRIDATVVRIH